MRSGGAVVRLRRAVLALGVVAGVFVLAGEPGLRSAEAPAEIRALWVLRTSLSTPAAITTLVKTAHEHGFNTLLVQVRGRGDAYYLSRYEPRAPELVRQPASFDPLANVIAEAHRNGLGVHAWINLNLISSAVELPQARDHLVYQHPDWLMMPREIAQDVARIEPDSPAYLGKLARWTRAQSEFEGLYASPILPDAAAHAEAVVADIAARYTVDGIHLDYARYPNDQFDYSRFAIASFRADMQPRLTGDVRRSVDAQETVDLFAYPDRFPSEWRAFRRARLSALMARLRVAIRTARPEAILSVAAAPDAQEAFDVRLQDWRSWLENRLVDAVCPMAYTQEAGRFAEQIAAARDIAGGHAIWAGIGAYRLPPDQTIANIQTSRRLGTAGFVLFSYDSLTGPQPPAADYLATVSRAAFGTTHAADSDSRK